MSSKMPPVPPGERSPKGPGSDPKMAKSNLPHGQQRPQNLKEQDQEGNTRINTTNKGHQQDR